MYVVLWCKRNAKTRKLYSIYKVSGRRSWFLRWLTASLSFFAKGAWKTLCAIIKTRPRNCLAAKEDAGFLQKFMDSNDVLIENPTPKPFSTPNPASPFPLSRSPKPSTLDLVLLGSQPFWSYPSPPLSLDPLAQFPSHCEQKAPPPPPRATSPPQPFPPPKGQAQVDFRGSGM